jgi:hypothetical protein
MIFAAMDFFAAMEFAITACGAIGWRLITPTKSKTDL